MQERLRTALVKSSPGASRITRSYSEIALDHSFDQFPLIDKIKYAYRIVELSHSRTAGSLEHHKAQGLQRLNSTSPASKYLCGRRDGSVLPSPQDNKKWTKIIVPTQHKKKHLKESARRTKNELQGSRFSKSQAVEEILRRFCDKQQRLKIQATSIDYQKLAIRDKQLDVDIDSLEADIKYIRVQIERIVNRNRVLRLRTRAELEKVKEKEILLALYDDYVVSLCSRQEQSLIKIQEEPPSMGKGESRGVVKSRLDRLEEEKISKQLAKKKFDQETLEYEQEKTAMLEQLGKTAMQYHEVTAELESLRQKNDRTTKELQEKVKSLDIWIQRQKGLLLRHKDLKLEEREARKEIEQILAELRFMNDLTGCHHIHKDTIKDIGDCVEQNVALKMREVYELAQETKKTEKAIQRIKDDIHRNHLRLKLKDSKIEKMQNILEYQKEQLCVLEELKFSRHTETQQPNQEETTTVSLVNRVSIQDSMNFELPEYAEMVQSRQTTISHVPEQNQIQPVTMQQLDM